MRSQSDEPARGSSCRGDYKVGPGKPPLETRWRKGAPSPNPRGRPPRKRLGHVSEMLSRPIEVSSGGNCRTITNREALDLSLRSKAIEEGGAWKKLWDQQQRLDGKLEERSRRSQELAARMAEQSTAARVRREIRLNDLAFALIERISPGLLDTLRVLGSRAEGTLAEISPDFAPAVSRGVIRAPEPQSGGQDGSPRPPRPPRARKR